jgi:hypothetical protein
VASHLKWGILDFLRINTVNIVGGWVFELEAEDEAIHHMKAKYVCHPHCWPPIERGLPSFLSGTA